MLFGKRKLSELREEFEIALITLGARLRPKIKRLEKDAGRMRNQIGEALTARNNLSTRITKLELEIAELKGKKRRR